MLSKWSSFAFLAYSIASAVDMEAIFAINDTDSLLLKDAAVSKHCILSSCVRSGHSALLPPIKNPTAPSSTFFSINVCCISGHK